MDDYEPYFGGASPAEHDSEKHVTFEDLSRKDTATSKAVSEPGSDNHPTCRICRSEGTPDEPLFHPCKCSGSIQYVHQECLMEWLSHSHKKHCELCKTPFRFTKLYDADMPANLPWDVFIKRALIHVGQGISNTARGILVGFVWLVILPFSIRYAWRWMFWAADAGWARELYLHNIKRLGSDGLAELWAENSSLAQGGGNALGDEQVGSMNEIAYNAYKDFMSSLGFDLMGANSTGTNTTVQTSQWPQADTSIFSSWFYLSELTPNAKVNRVLLDIFEGQLITCVVIIGFILIFLIREWVVQQQPLVNMEQLNNVQQQLREAADRVQEENERFRRQQELLDQARRRLLELQRETEDAQRQTVEDLDDEGPEFMGWEALEEIIDGATEMLGQGDRQGFETQAPIFTEQIRAAGHDPSIDLNEFTDRVYAKLASYPDAERREWEALLVAEIRRKNERPVQAIDQNSSLQGETSDSETTEEENDPVARPPMPERDFSSRATQIQRLLEEADGIFGQVHGDAAAREVSSSGQAAPTEAGPDSARSPSTERWQSISLPGESSSTEKVNESTERSSESQYDAEKEEIPITNAGPNAKINIKRSGTGKARAVPEPKTEDKNSPENKEKKKIDGEVKELEKEIAAEDASTNDLQSTESQSAISPDSDGQQPDRSNDDSLAGRVGSAFREEFGLDEITTPDNRHLAGSGQNEASTQEAAAQNEDTEHRQGLLPQRRVYERVADWFWGEIQAPNSQEPVPAAREERLDDQAAAGGLQAAPIHDDNMEPGQDQRPENDNQPDPEVVAAAAQAGLDAEAVEDAEDLEGIFELIGLQGPLTALLQTSMFCLVLVSGTVFSAVGLPYVFGKLVLSIIGSPIYFIFKMPLQMASFIADFIIDTSLLVGGWSVMVIGMLSDALYMTVGSMMHLPASKLLQGLIDASSNTATASGERLARLFITDATSDLGLSGAFLGASVHSHASLRALQEETNAVLSFIGRCITYVVETVSSGSFTTIWQSAKTAMAYVPAVPAQMVAGAQAVQQYAAPLLEALATLKTGALTLSVPSNSPASIDPALIFWDSSDRLFAVVTGYIALAMVAALYVAADTPITSSPAGQRHEKMIRDTLRQAGGVLKVILIISIEMLMFPLYCGLLLDVAFLPLFGGATMFTRLAFAASKPYTFCFMHWFVGTCYMFHFALFVGMCRKILRKGVLWFIRDPDDPTFHPVRDVLERNVITQLRKIAFSALVYGALVILCLGGVIWTIGKLFSGIFPIQWITTEPVLEFPIDLLLYNFVTPLLVRLFKPSDTVNTLFAWWLRRCARVLRLSHFMFDDRRKDEEGYHVRKTWTSLLLMRQAETSDEKTVQDDNTSDVYLQRDGKYVLTPCSDQYRPPKAGEAFLHTDDEDVYIVDKDGKKNEHFAKMYVPPLFRVRVTLFLVCLWLFSATTGLGATLVPLVFGRRAIQWVFPGIKVNDIYAYTVGAYTLSGVLFAALKSGQAVRHVREKAQTIDLRAWCIKAASIAVRFAKCVYVYGFLGIILPTFFAFILQFYLILPLHTYLVASAHEQATLNAADSASNSTILQTLNQTINLLNTTAPANSPPSGPRLASHSIHVLQDFALGLLYCRIVSRAITSGSSSRAKEAFRRITATGYLDPNTRLATRFIVLPSLVLAVFAFALPPLGAWLAINVAQSTGYDLQDDVRTLVYRYAYPALGAVLVALFLVFEVSRATERWRARVRDEVYLVGERLHNFGEKKPPAGTKSVVRRERVVGRREVDLEF
jgi:E3 ubiquitin-protein ligase MARCH6